MKKISILLLIVLMAACGKRPDARPQEEAPANTQQTLPGDSTLYGLACDGCTDSVLVILPYSGGEPDTFDIINAFHERRVYGRPHIGDELAVIINPEDKDEALMVINVETLKGEWCYQVMPTLRHAESMPQRIQRRMMEHMPDTLKQQLLVPREYGIKMKRGNVAQTIGGARRQATTDDMSPVEYPQARRYTEWHLYNGRLILTVGRSAQADSLNPQKPEHDTADIHILREDTLVLRFADHEQSYYRK